MQVDAAICMQMNHFVQILCKSQTEVSRRLICIHHRHQFK
jgi:hypothetical protein